MIAHGSDCQQLVEKGSLGLKHITVVGPVICLAYLMGPRRWFVKTSVGGDLVDVSFLLADQRAYLP